MPGSAIRSTPSSARCVLPAEIGGATGTIAERVEVAARRGAVQRAAARARARWAPRTPPAAAARARPARGARRRDSRFDTANRASADLLALRLPPACSRARRRRHMSSARRSIAGVTRGTSASPSTLRTVSATCDNVVRTRTSPGAQAVPVSTLDPMRIAIGGDHAGYPLKQHLVGVLKEWGHDVDDLGTDSTETGRLPAVSARRWRGRSCSGEADVGHRARRQRPGRADLGQQGARRAGRALQRPLHAPAWPASTTTPTCCRSARASSRPSWPRRSPGSSSTTPFEGGRHQRRIDEITEIEIEEDVDDARRWSAPIPRSPTSSSASSSARTRRSS